jgi:hypothetical protein
LALLIPIVASSLAFLTMKNIRFNWGLPQGDSFMKLVTLAPILVLPDNNNLPFRLEADGSGITTGAVLF